MKYRKWLVPLVCMLLLVAALALVLYANTISHDVIQTNAGSGQTAWSDGWTLPDGAPVVFPCRLSDDGAPVTLRKRLPDSLARNCYLYVKTNYQYISVSVDGAALPIDALQTSGSLHLNANQPWARAAVTGDCAGGMLTLTIGADGCHGSKQAIELYDVRLGADADVCLRLFQSALPRIVLCIVMLLLALALVFFGLTEARRYRGELASFLYIFVFVALSCVWFFCDSNVTGLRYIRSDAFLLCTIFSYMLFPLPIMLHLRSAFPKLRRLLLVEAALVALNALTQGVLMLTGGFALSWALSISHALLAVANGTLLVGCWQKHGAAEGRVDLNLRFGLVILSLTGVLTMAQFYLTTTEDNSMAFRYGLLVFIIALTINALKRNFDYATKASSYEQLRIREEEYRIAVQQSDKYVLRYEIDARTIHQQNDAAELFGLDTDVPDAPRRLLESGMVADESREDFRAFFDDMIEGRPTGSGVFSLRDASGRFTWYRADYTTIFRENGTPLQSIVSFFDITDLREKELAYEKWKQNYSELPTASINYYEYNLTRDLFDREEGGLLPAVPENVSRNLTSIAGYIAERYAYPADQDKFRAFFDRRHLLDSYERGIRSEKMDVRRVGGEGEPLWTTASVQLISDPYSNDVKAFLLLKDVDEEKREELKQRARSDADPLTGLLNRTAFVEHMNELIGGFGKEYTHALIMIDVDGFKRVNDTFGHQFGDRVLIDVANDLRAMMRADDLIGRIGGDEYIVCLKNVPAESDFLERRSETICQTLSKQFGVDVAISGSLGLALYPRDGTAFDELYQKADKALYFAKHHGKNRFVFYNSDLHKGDVTAPSAQGMIDAPVEESVVAQQQKTERTLLIVDDVELNREILGEIFHEDYHILMAENGADTLKLLQSAESPISAVLLDLIMPGMSGLEVLEAMQNDAFMNTIPVIVASAADETEYSLRAVELGATDFVSKPIDPRLVKLRVRNAIQKRETEELRAQNRYLLVQKSDESRHQNELRYLAEHDALTNICNKASFYRKTKTMLDAAPDTTFVMISFDIEKFRVINDIFGHEEGDRLLRYIAQRLQALFRGKATYSRIDADNFTVCLPYDAAELKRLSDACDAEMATYDLPFQIMLCYGLYIIDDRSLAVSIMHDRAEMAKRTVKGNYLHRFAYYDSALREELLKELDVVNQMQSALDGGQFDIYLQPKCRLHTREIVGAEALVRWVHPERGVLLPGTFIPIFEKNGFIMKLDAYVWERVCQLLRRWMDENGGHCPIRVSTNISRVDIYNPNLCKTLIELVRKYDIPPELMELEITESAYADNAKMLLDVVDELRRNGFVVEMDDFGSGYSSLNMLKEITVDVLKIDMRFLFGRDEDGRGGSILSSVVRMARWLSLPVVAEGVENAEQAEFLYSIGCDSAQGYFFYHPMPVEEFERLLAEKPHAETGPVRPVAMDESVRRVWSAEGDFSRMLTATECGACLCEMSENNIEIVRVNDEYLRMTHETPQSMYSRGMSISSLLSDEDYHSIAAALTDARLTGKHAEGQYVRFMPDGGRRTIRYAARYLTGDEKRALFFVTYQAVDDGQGGGAL